MFKKGKSQQYSKKDMLFDKLVEQFDCTEAQARRYLRDVQFDVLEEIINAKVDKLERDFVADERKVEKANEALKRNKKFQEATENLKVLRMGHSNAMKKFKSANKLRMQALEMRCSDE